jgi:non-ribosomal peptide synthetase component F
MNVPINWRHFLISRDVEQESLVPLLIDRSVEMVVSILAILKTGAAYVPIDPAYPEERIRFMLQDTGASIAITTSNHTTKLQSVAIETIALDNEAATISQAEHKQS